MKSNTYLRACKKAQISSVFKYIFVLVAGSIILLFFIKFAIQTEKGGQEIIKTEILHMLDSSLQAFSIAESSSSLIPNTPWPKQVHVKFGTKANCGKFMMVGQKFFVPIERVIFGPSEMKARQLQAWTISWRFPFRITNIFYLTNPGSKHYLIYDSSNEQFLRKISSYPPATKAFEMDHFPKNFGIRIVNSEIEPRSKLKTLDMVKVNYFEQKSGVGQGLKGSYIKASPECEDENEESYKCYGEITFFDGNQETGTSTFVGREMMFGAIIADSYEEYECQYSIALRELERLINLYTTKAQKLNIKKPDCETNYQSMVSMLNQMKTAINTLKTSQTYDNAAVLSSSADGIKRFNENEIAGDEDCEMVF